MATLDGSHVKKLIVACDAGMGSSIMLASSLKKLLKKNGVHVEHSAVREIPADADVVVTQNNLAARAREVVTEGTPIVPFQLFMGDPAVARLVEAIQSGSTIEV
ncbi:PTS system mannitol-specific IIB component [Frondihabitans sp. PhB188]|uniref:PTS lactose transporter subunit IIB n=1 Tax=Frondihabitans sp. PhB188 TaxID=2485200 RepID=UPI000F483B68|nr:PTS lactose transporter subunit IIB [Frondihabitans sp. PhB188]ROQ41004.1 PTS system mannitol-specific IIB component [Frondihabitans sp. PhB188]